MTTPGQRPSLEITGAIATISLARADVANRLELEDLEAIRMHVAKVNGCKEVMVLRIRAEGKSFCGGFNIGSIGGPQTTALFEQMVNDVAAARPVTVAALNGGLYGGATDLALSCDFRLGVPECQMFVPAAQFGLLFYRSGMARYVTRLGLGNAKRILLTGAKLDSNEMLRVGFLDQIVEMEKLAVETDALSYRLAGMAPLALLGMKKYLNQIADGALDIASCEADIAAADVSEDLDEGTRAWSMKRKPDFKGR
ncbi:3-hydroxybutyryl-CoA dehydratase [Acidocella aquatica]|uniref:3-hydroxybutyryl-CoA dehydratase n=1 Tax=Acidocella aquatica TaxID=1922313 RepID=A0ABQ6A7Z0_9PROT|nr:enoyl-CoA hydratase/isomerase family protein [Acidocella aquatica]GLR66976.1 3-hydroxybutyryl-CoA dehydratase [Acidocella aquatica]